MSKALGLLSGGLDSSLAAMTLKRQGVEVTCVCYVTPFFGADKAIQTARRLDIPLIVDEIGPLHLEMVKQPRYGYGRNLNPCIDCHAMMFRLAGERMAQEGFDYLFSGEVLGQRPMSQNPTALRAVAKYSGHPDRILRPLSARLLPPTPMEEAGLVDRERLLDIQGRSRKRQEALAAEWGVVDYPSAGGGCLLTEPNFTRRLRDLLQHEPDCGVDAVELLKAGRHFRLSSRAKLIVGRDQADNEKLEQLARPQDLRLRCRDFSGPLGLLVGAPNEEDLQLAAGVLAGYGKGREASCVAVLFVGAAQRRTLETAPLAREEGQQLLL